VKKNFKKGKRVVFALEKMDKNTMEYFQQQHQPHQQAPEASAILSKSRLYNSREKRYFREWIQIEFSIDISNDPIRIPSCFETRPQIQSMIKISFIKRRWIIRMILMQIILLENKCLGLKKIVVSFSFHIDHHICCHCQLTFLK
jgi:hypothetical protein